MSLSTKIRTITRLAQAGVLPSSISRLALQKAVNLPSGTIRLKNGMVIEGPQREPLGDIFKEIWLDRRYAENVLDAASPGFVVDIGSHVGIFAMWMASTNPNVKVCCMEPSPHLCPYLQRNISANGFSNISFLQAACGGSTREATLHVADHEWGNSLYGDEKKAADGSQLIKTKVLTLQGVLEHFGIAVCDFLKIDCEGAEYEILLNADRDTLARVRSIALEYHLDLGSGSLPELEQHLLSTGFTVKSEPASINRGYLYAFQAPVGHHAR